MASATSPAEGQLSPTLVTFANRGLVLKNQPGTLQPGEYQELTNCVSVQENSISVRQGNQALTSQPASFPGDSVGIISTITKLHTASQDYRYIGAAGATTFGSIWRSTGALPAFGANMAFTKVAFNVAPNITLGIDYIYQRFSGVRYNAGSTGTPYEFFACPSKMLKDTGTLNSGDGTGDGTILQKWGILAPTAPALPTLDAVTILPGSEIISGSGRLNVTVSSSVPASGGAGYYVITPSAMADPTSGSLIVEGMLVVINSTNAIVQQTTATTFGAYLAGAPSGAITSGATSYTAAPTTFSYSSSIDASFNGIAPDYTSDDVIHLAVSLNDATQFTDVRVRVFVGSTGTTDYYEKILEPSGLQPQVSGTATATSTVQSQVALVDTGVIQGFDIPVESVDQAVPISLNLTSPVSSGTNPVWTEVDIPKNQFLPVGNAGTASSTWKNITGFAIVAEVPSGSTGTIAIGSLYVAGGYGPLGFSSSLTTPLLAYSYIYTYRNPVTGAHGNPSVAMISNNFLEPLNQQIAVTCQGTGDPQIAGASSIAIYRQGGSLQDGLYRFVGYATNPGAGAAVTFLDSATDDSIIDNSLVAFDNDAPIVSSLPTPLNCAVSAITGSGAAAQSVTVTLTLPGSISTLVGYITVGTTISISSGNSALSSNFEDCVVSAVGSNTLSFYIQYSHSTGDTVNCSAIANGSANIAISALDAIFVAGDKNNPHVLYKSKNGMPESFPVLELETGIADQINVGSPSDPIMALVEYSSAIICLNLSHIYVVNVFAGAMQAPIETPANRGVVGTYAWCKADNEIWYVSYDGVYSWSGGQSKKRSEAIDPLFKGYNLGFYFPIQMGPLVNVPNTPTGAQIITMSYYQNEIILTYVDTNQTYHRLRYNTIHDRWWIEDIYDKLNTPTTSPVAITAQYVEPDTGNFLIAKAFPSSAPLAYLDLDNVGISDGWIGTNTGETYDGAPIRYIFKTAGYTLGAPSLNKNFVDMVLEFNNDYSTFGYNIYYDFSATPNSTDSNLSPGVLAPLSPLGRRRLPFSFGGSFGTEAYAFQLEVEGAFVGSSIDIAPATFYSLTINAYPLEQIQIGRTMDWMDLGHPFDKRLYELVVTHDVITGQTVTLNLDIMTGANDTQAVTNSYQTFTLNPVSGDAGHPHRVTANFPITDGTVVKRVRLRPTIGNIPFKLWMDANFKFEAYPPDIVPFTEYSTYDHPYDKHLFVLWANVDTNGQNVQVQIEADGVYVQTVTLNGTFNNRSIPVGVNVDIIGKLIRIAVVSVPIGGKFQLFDHRFDYEKFPADIILNTEYRDFGYPYLKYLQALVLDINTNNQVVPIQVVGDGNVLQTVNVHSTIQTRDQRFALSIIRDSNGIPIPASKVRLVINPALIPPTGRVQLWTWDVVHEKADLGPITHTTDWDNLKWPYDKELQEITFQYDNNNSGPVTMLMDIMTGVQGGTITIAAYSFSLNQATRAIQTFPFPDGVYVKQIRIYPQSDYVSWRNWKYLIKAENQPADVTEWTDWNNLGWPCEKIARNLILDINTGGVPATITLQADGNTMQTFTATTTYPTRDVVLPCNSNLIGRLWRLLLAPGTNGSAQLFGWKLDYVKEPCAVDYMDTYEQDFGVPNWKFMKTMWLRYASTASITITFYVENDTAFYSLTLPQNNTREYQKFYFPSINSGVLNKSRTYRILIQSSGLFKIYADSIIEYEVFGEDQIRAFKINPSSPELQFPVASPTIGGASYQIAEGGG